MYTMKLACDMAKCTIKDIHKSADGEALTSTEMDDLHHAMEVIKDVYVTKEMHIHTWEVDEKNKHHGHPPKLFLHIQTGSDNRTSIAALL